MRDDQLRLPLRGASGYRKSIPTILKSVLKVSKNDFWRRETAFLGLDRVRVARVNLAGPFTNHARLSSPRPTLLSACPSRLFQHTGRQEKETRHYCYRA